MFNKLKQFKDIRSQAKDLQNKLSEESVSVNNNGITLTMDGNLKIIKLDIELSLLTPEKKNKLENAIKDAYDDAMKKMQRIMAMKMREMGGLPNIPGIS